MKEKISFIMRYPAAREEGRRRGHWKVTMAGGMGWGELQRARH